MNYLVCLCVSVCIKYIYKSKDKIMRVHRCSTSVTTLCYADAEKIMARGGMDIERGV